MFKAANNFYFYHFFLRILLHTTMNYYIFATQSIALLCN